MESNTILSMESNAKFIETEYIKKLTDRALGYLNTGFPVHLRGMAGVGKTSFAFHIAERIGKPVIFICGNEEFSSFDLVGGDFGVKKSVTVDNYISSVFKKEEEFKKLWMDGRLLSACKYGYTLIYDEFTRARPESNNILLTVLEEKMIELPSTYAGEPYLKVHPDFKVIFTSNPEEYAGVYKSPNALLDRMITIDIDIMDVDTEKAIIIAQSGIDEKSADKIVHMTRLIRNTNKENEWASLRSSIMLAKVLKGRNIKLNPQDIEFRQVCRDVYNSSSLTSRMTSGEKEGYIKLIDRVISMALSSGKE